MSTLSLPRLLSAVFGEDWETFNPGGEPAQILANAIDAQSTEDRATLLQAIEELRIAQLTNEEANVLMSRWRVGLRFPDAHRLGLSEFCADVVVSENQHRA